MLLLLIVQGEQLRESVCSLVPVTYNGDLSNWCALLERSVRSRVVRKHRSGLTFATLSTVVSFHLPLLL